EGVAVVGGPNEAAGGGWFSRGVATLPTHGPSRGAVFLFAPNKYHKDFETTTDVYASVTRNSLFRKEAVEQVGGFDEALVVTEDPELNRRLLDAGWRLRYRAQAEVRHVHRDRWGSFFSQQRKYAFWQAHVNRKHPKMFQPKHWLPTAALLAFLWAVWLGVAIPGLWILPSAMLGVGLLVTFSYAAYA